MTYAIRRANPGDLDALYALRTEAEQWLAAAGVEQWTPRWHDHARGLIRDSVHAGETWVVEHQDDVIATARIAGPDRDFWAPDDALGAADYLYKLIVSRSHAGSGLGDAVIDWACGHAARRGRQWLRIDIWRTNAKLRQYYESRGFTHVRTVVVPGRSSGLLLQRPVDLRTAPAGIHLEAAGEKQDEEAPSLAELTR
ncbi:GNAT family N-acetyltransferase [Microtetraspora fusca]|uniref:GNAT family N-acetyltransferase n=1 Tax=Microtetraspora fusca TaxID=1997 RepID=A0ABW6VG36_MICFU